MPSTLPDGDPAPADGALPAGALAELGQRPFGFYVHVPFCTTRCGYCDFNTYTASELGGGGSQAAYAETAAAEIALATTVIGERRPPVSTVFFGGGTPTLLPASDLIRLLDEIRDRFDLADGAEVTTEANPESVDNKSLALLRAAGFTRISFGMQSVAPHVLAVLDRRHTPGRAAAAVVEAQAAGFEHISVDLIYGTPGETDDDWRRSLQAAVDTGIDHVSAYSLIVEPGTRLAARVDRGELPVPDDDVLAERYLMAEEVLAAAGLQWYELSNWSRTAAGRSQHNLLYWTGGDWWGVGPGAHSHVGGVRWWNVKHPSAYAQRLTTGKSPAAGREHLTLADRDLERVLLGMRLREGLPVGRLPTSARHALSVLHERGLIATPDSDDARVVLTLAGRLLADAVVRELVA